jgi:hypothetical protein
MENKKDDLINDIEKNKETVNLLKAELTKKNISDFIILNFIQANTLVIAGSFDFSYYHNVEIIFEEVTYISCPVSFDNATFRLANKSERSYLKDKLFDGWEDTIICICINEDISDACVKHFIVAKNIKYTFKNTYYYKKDNLQKDECIADWV